MNSAMIFLGLFAIIGAAAGHLRPAPALIAESSVLQEGQDDPDDPPPNFQDFLDASGEGFAATFFAPGQGQGTGSKPTFILVPHRPHQTLHNELVGVRPARANSNEPLVDFAGIFGPWPVLDQDGDDIPGYIDEDGNPDPAGNPNPEAMAIAWYSNPIVRLVIRKGLLILRGIRPVGGMELGAGEAMPGEDGDGDTPLFQGVGGKVDGSSDTNVTLFIELLPPVKDDAGNVIRRSAVLYVYAADTLGGHARVAFRGVPDSDITFDNTVWTPASISSGSYNRPTDGSGYVMMESIDNTNSACFHFWPKTVANVPVGQFVTVTWSTDKKGKPYEISDPADWSESQASFVAYCKKLMDGAGIPTP